MEELRRVAFETVLRACSFGTLAIFCVMVGMSFNARAAFQAGGFLTTIMALILVMKARMAMTQNYRHMEMWLYLEKHQKPPESFAQYVTSTVMRETYLRFALWTSMVAIAMWLLALATSLLGVTGGIES
jgi:hypothetical protein